MSLRTIRQYAALPSLPTRGLMPPIVGVVIPLDRTNLITNPSIELATTGYTAVGGSIARSTVQQYHGTYSLAITPSAGTNSDGAFYGTISMASGTPYAYSVKFRATGDGIGRTYALSVATTGGIDLAVTQFVATGRWQWIRGVWGENSTTTRRIYIRKVNHNAASVFYTDGWQVEQCSDGVLDATTYIDGDQLGLLIGQQPPGYGWNGTPHASTSYRTALTRAGGYLVNLSTYNFLLTGLIGLGMATPNNVSVPYTVLDGARYLRTTKPPRTFSLPGRFQADDIFTLLQSQADMRQALDRDLTPQQQPLVLMVEPQDECGNVIGDFATVPCLYAGGLEGNDSNLPIEDVAPTFTMYLPYLIGPDGGAALAGQQTVTNATSILQRSPVGAWSALGTGVTGGGPTVLALAYGLDNNLYAGGVGTDFGGSGADNIGRWDGTTWTALASVTAVANVVRAIAVGPDGRIYVGGDFINVNGIAAADGVAVYDPVANTWASLGTGITGGLAQVYALAFSASGLLYAGGNFTTAGGVAVNNIASWNPVTGTWAALGTGITGGTGIVFRIVVAPNGVVYAGGGFTTAGGVSATNIARWSPGAATWAALGAGITGGSVFALAIGPDGSLYVGHAGVGTDPRARRWNGTSFVPLGSGLNGSPLVFKFDQAGRLWAGGNFTTADGVAVPDHAAIWTGSNWVHLDVDFPGAPDVNAFAMRGDGTIIAGYNGGGGASAVAPTVTVVTNGGPGIVYPRVIIRGPTSGTAQIFQMLNYTNAIGPIASGLYFNYTMNVGEVITITADPTNPSIISSFQGDISYAVLPGSSALYLAPGTNTLSFYASSATVTATISWPTRYNGVSDLVN